MGHLLRVYRKDFMSGRLIDSDQLPEMESMGWRDSPEKLHEPISEAGSIEAVEEKPIKETSQEVTNSTDKAPKKRGRPRKVA